MIDARRARKVELFEEIRPDMDSAIARLVRAIAKKVGVHIQHGNRAA